MVLNHDIEVRRLIEEVVAYATTDECSLNTLRCANLAIKLYEAAMVVILIGT